MASEKPKKEKEFKYKRCPECFAKLPLDAKVCHSCNQKVLEPDKYGLAKKPFNWLGYGSVVILWTIFGYFVWWAFMKTQ